MLTPYRPQFVEKLFTDHMGRQFRLVFVLALVDGEVRGRLVSATPITSSVSSQPCPTCLPIRTSQIRSETPYIAPFTSVTSPFNALYFFVSQPTRAPNNV